MASKGVRTIRAIEGPGATTPEGERPLRSRVAKAGADLPVPVPTSGPVATAPTQADAGETGAQAAWTAAAALPHRLMVAWLESHLQLVETTFALASHRLTATEMDIERTLELCGQLAATDDPAKRAQLQVDYTLASLEQGFIAARERYELLNRFQHEALRRLGDRAFEAWAALQASKEVGGTA